MAKGTKYISEPGDIIPFQSRLTSAPGFKQTQLKVFPEAESSTEALEDILSTGGIKGNDWEFRPDLTPTICAVTTLNRVYSAGWSPAFHARLKTAMASGVSPDGTRYRWVAHSTVGADKAVADKVFGITTSLADWDDSMISHYLANQHLVKAPDKDESDDAGSLGFMNLWHTASLVTDWSNWKFCRQAICPGPDPGTPGYSRLAPCPIHSAMSYCGIDAIASPIAHVHNMEVLRSHGMPDIFYRDMMEMSEICYLMEKQGIKTDREYVKAMSKVADEKKASLFPVNGKAYEFFNPKSSPQVLAWFKARGVTLKKADKDAIVDALDFQAKREGFVKGKESIDEDDDPQMSETLSKLYDLVTYKTEGKGLDPWFGDKYLDKNGFVHPRFVLTGTSTGRLSSSRPNFQNVPRRGVFGEMVRGAIIPRDESLDLVKGDFSQLEFRVVLYLAGQPYSGTDVFNWMVEQTGDSLYKVAKEFDPVKYAKDPLKAARDITKSVAHGGNYGEGMILLDSDDVYSPRTQKLADAGALSVYTTKYQPGLKKDWTFHNKVVAFTGGNLAERLFGDKSEGNRAKALDLQEKVYFKRFFAIREWQMRVLEFVEANGYVQSPTGRFLRLLGTPEDIAKVAIAFLGQGVGADHDQGITLHIRKQTGMIPLLKVHDENVFEIPKALTNSQACDIIRLMESETRRLPGFTNPIEAKRGPNWKDMTTIYKG